MQLRQLRHHDGNSRSEEWSRSSGGAGRQHFDLSRCCSCLLKARGCRNSHYTPSYIRLMLKQFEPSILCVFQVIFWLLSRLKDLLNIGSANDRGDPCGKSPHVSPFLRLLVSFVPNANANANAFVFCVCHGGVRGGGGVVPLKGRKRKPPPSCSHPSWNRCTPLWLLSAVKIDISTASDIMTIKIMQHEASIEKS